MMEKSGVLLPLGKTFDIVPNLECLLPSGSKICFEPLSANKTLNHIYALAIADLYE